MSEDWDTPEVREQVRESIKRQMVEMTRKCEEDAKKKIESGFADDFVVVPEEEAFGARGARPVFAKEAKEKYSGWTEMGRPITDPTGEEVADDMARREKEQKAIYNDLMTECERLDAAEHAAWLVKREERRLKPINDAEAYLAGCTDEKDAESCAYWKAKREDLLATNFNTKITDVDLGDEVPKISFRDTWISEMDKTLSQFPEIDAESWKDLWDGKISIEKHREQLDEINSEMYGLRLENQFFKTTNRVLTILLVFSTAFGIAAALAWLRCQ